MAAGGVHPPYQDPLARMIARFATRPAVVAGDLSLGVALEPAQRLTRATPPASTSCAGRSTVRTAMASAFRWPTSTTSCRPRVIPVYSRLRCSIG